MIRVALGSIYHVGIYVSDDEVIQFGLAPTQRNLTRDSDIEVLSSDIYTFLAGGFLEVCVFDRREKRKHRKPDQVVEYARSKIGSKGYNIIYNNCEHFANECISGERICHQADDVRAMFRNMPIVDVYTAALPDRDIDGTVASAVRQADIDRVSNDSVKREKYYVWKLLEYGLERSLGLKIAELEFKCDESGRYYANGVEFSLSHSKGALCVAISRGRVGVDIEELSAPVREGMPKRFMTDTEYAEYTALDDEEKQKRFVEAWSAKEAVFKSMHAHIFEPAAIELSSHSYRSYVKAVGGKEYILSVATATPERIRFYENITI